jgi:hypothetical protein
MKKINANSMNQTKCQKCESFNIIMVEYEPGSPEHFDGISEINCLACGARFGRWSGKELVDGEIEKKYGK